MEEERNKREIIIIIKIIIIKSLADPILRYSSGIINCGTEEIKEIDRKTRKMLTMYKMHRPKADMDRLYINRKDRGRGLVQIKVKYKAEIINIAEYLNTNYKEDQFCKYC